MTESKSHKVLANKLAKKLNTEYHSDKGADIVTTKVAIEVEIPGGIPTGIQQLQGYRKQVYIAVTNKKAEREAIEKTKNTTVGIINSEGIIVKKSTRKKS